MALYLYLLDEGWDFEAVFVDHGTDWPETYKYVEMFKKKYPLTVLKPLARVKKNINREFDNLYEYSHATQMFPNRVMRWCTHRFKSKTLQDYYHAPCFVLIGYDYSERHRAKIHSFKGQEFRFPLIEAEITRDGCKKIITDHGLPIPMKSGCYICPFQRVGHLRELRKKHPDLFCKLEQLEKRNNYWRVVYGSSDVWPWVQEPYYSFGKPVREVAEKGINQKQLWAEDEYPPCECVL